MIHSKEKKNTRVKQNLLSLVPEKFVISHNPCILFIFEILINPS